MKAKTNTSTSATFRSARKKPSHDKSTKKRWPLVLLVCTVVLALIAGILLYRHHQNQQAQQKAYKADKAAFAQTEKDMQKAYNGIVAGVGKPDRESSEKGCSTLSLKFDDSYIICSIYYYFGYGLNNERGVQFKLEQITQILKSDYGLRMDSGLPRQLVNGKTTITLDGEDSFSCGVDVWSGKSIADSVFNNSNLADVFGFSCSKKVTKPIYPLAE